MLIILDGVVQFLGLFFGLGRNLAETAETAEGVLAALFVDQHSSTHNLCYPRSVVRGVGYALALEKVESEIFLGAHSSEERLAC